ncbi:hypothetical protein LOTGIDRAFT_171075 [Lottia gigantea]|uniref:Uncharacterized protein n=1 Tax=Lottia gigantea TaxID=225164 RepID=V4B1C6_LOTGI|nr:hypothetical protein LOTGIDRAFT_171075 [Lottia gigantea]ESP04103.1 hypothetical protein LOTGIDRAFT_171075 [Lottia gigantea]
MVRYNIDYSESGVVVPGPSHEPVNKTMPDKVNDVEEYIRSFPKVDSHYCRSSTKRDYLEPTLNIRMMYRLYNESCGDRGMEPVKENVYRKIFNEKFNLGFHKPSKDMCDSCALYDNLKKADGLTKEHQTARDAHLARKVEAREA